MAQKWIRKMHDELLKLQDRFGTLQEFYCIPDKRLQIQFEHTEGSAITFHVLFDRSMQTSLLKDKISKYVLMDVARFAKENIHIKLVVNYLHDYPFKPPTWSLDSYSDNILKEDISKYYEHIIQSHNEVYSIGRQWSPLIPLRVDFLDLLAKLIMGIKYTLSVDSQNYE